jgi:hypothetical protein
MTTWRCGVARIYFMAPHRHLRIDVTVTSARTKSNVLAVGLPSRFMVVAMPRLLKKVSFMMTSALRRPWARPQLALPLRF